MVEKLERGAPALAAGEQKELEALLLELEQWERARGAPPGSESLDFRKLK